jgi:hypothetical protein
MSLPKSFYTFKAAFQSENITPLKRLAGEKTLQLILEKQKGSKKLQAGAGAVFTTLYSLRY